MPPPHIKAESTREKLPSWELTSSPVLKFVIEKQIKRLQAEKIKSDKAKFLEEAWNEKKKLDRLERAAKRKKLKDANKLRQKIVKKYTDNPKL